MTKNNVQNSEEKNIITLDFSFSNIPIPFESKNTSDHTYVQWGLDNLYPNFLIGLYTTSSVHSAVVNQKTSYIIGGGIKIGEDTITNDTIMVNPSDGLEELVHKLTKDYILFNSFAVEVIFNVFGEPINYIHIPVHKLRMNRMKTKFFYCDDWSYSRKFIEYERYNPNVKITDPKSRIFYFDGYFPSINNVYPSPEYSASIKAIVTDASITEFNLNNIKNHFSPSTVITFFNGANVTDKVKQQITNEINEKFKGETGKKFIVDFQHKDGKPAEIKQLSANDWDKAYVEINNRNIDNIMIGHEVQNPSLFGVKTGGQLGSSQEIESSYEMFKNNYISVKRSELQSAFNLLFKFYNKVNDVLSFFDKPLFSKKISEATKEKIYTIDELRIMDGSEPLPNGQGQKFIGDATPMVMSNEPQPIVGANDSIKNLTGRQYQNVMRIVRNYNNGKLTKSQASLMLKNGFELSDTDIEIFLSNDDSEISAEEIAQFTEKKKSDYKILTEDDFELVKDMGDDITNYEILFENNFDVTSDVSEFLIGLDIEDTRLSILQKRIKEELGIDITQDKLNRILNKLSESGVINYKNNEGKIRILPNKSMDPTKPSQSGELMTMYKYIKRPEVPGGDLIKTSRGFCVKLINNGRLYTREEIQQMSRIFEYDVFKYAGGYYHNPQTDETTPYCRHTWQSIRVRRK